MAIHDIDYKQVLEREIVLTRIIEAPQQVVFTAFSTAEALGE
jgi:uncharacterized protein YndB with AHSA1/START domain